MDNSPAAAPTLPSGEGQGRRRTVVKSLWRRIRKPLAQSRFVKNALASLLFGGLKFVRWTNPLAPGSSDIARVAIDHQPAIFALWHGQHIASPAFYPRWVPSVAPLVAMVSRSADGELNALVVEKFGFEAARGSGGREQVNHLEKGGARALIALKKALASGRNVIMIADIPNGTPREAGLGIVTLARLSGRPIVPVAIATSRRKVIEKSWDKTTINLPFGRSGLVVGRPVQVAADANASEMEEKRAEVTASLDQATEEAYRLADGAAR